MKRKYYNGTFLKKLKEQETFLFQRFEEEWDAIQKTERQKGRSEKLKAGGKAAGRVILGLLAVGGALTVALVAPKIFVLFDRSGRKRIFVDEEDYKKTKCNFKKNRSITLEEIEGGQYIMRITEKGRQRALGELYNNLKINEQRRWDGKWRVVMFDILEKHKNERDAFRYKLEQMGFYPLQKSVLVSPYPCENEIDFLVAVLGIGSYVRFFTTEDIGDVEELKRHFDL